jgi:hypothetical protein
MSLDCCVPGWELAMDRMTGSSSRPRVSDDDIARTVGDVVLSCPVEEAVAVVPQAAAGVTARHCGRDDRLATTNGRSRPC